MYTIVNQPKSAHYGSPTGTLRAFNEQGRDVVKAADKAYQTIRSNILSGKYPSRAHLKEEELAEEIGVSRTPIREALRRLNSEHLVRYVANQGATVARWSLDDVDQIFTLRSMLESYAAKLAAGRITDEEISDLESLARRMDAIASSRDKDSRERITPLNHEFHYIIVDAVKSEYLKRMLSWIIEIPIMLRTFTYYSDGDLRRSMDHHREIIAAFRAHDGEWAQAVMCSHIHAARRVYFDAQPLSDGVSAPDWRAQT